MPSPFPGMDPYLEAPDLWPDFHDALASEIRGSLNQNLPAPYYARLEMRPEVGVVSDEEDYIRRIIPDVSVSQSPDAEAHTGGTAVLDAPRTEVSPFVEYQCPDENGRHLFVEIRDPRRGHRLVTLIEILSPSAKRRGPDRLAFVKKQGEVLESDASLIEIDLLRDGERVLPAFVLITEVGQMKPPPAYLVLLNYAWRRGINRAFRVFPIGLRDVLPVIPIPLREGEDDVPLDLQYVFTRAYDSGPYRRGAVDYRRPPEPPLRPSDEEWGMERLRAARLIP